MSVDTILKKEGIENIRPLDTLTVNRIAKSISEKLSKAFEEHYLDESELFASICRLKMYYAKMPDDITGAKYFYKNNSIYYNEKFEISDLEEFAIHECIHYLQELKDEKGKLVRLGLCEIKDGNMAMNEAAVQLMAAVAYGREEDKVKYYDVFLSTKSPDYYPLECVLLNEMTYFTGNYPLYHSTLYSDDVFKNCFSGKYGQKTYKYIQKNIENIMDLEETLNNETMVLKYTNSSKKVKQINQFAEKCKEKIAKKFLETQDYIMKNCFNKEFDEIQTMEDLMYFKNKMYGFKDIIGYTVEYQSYNNYYVQKMKEFELKRELIENGQLENQVVNNIELVDTQTKTFSFIKRILIKLGLITKINREKLWVKDNSKQ